VESGFSRIRQLRRRGIQLASAARVHRAPPRRLPGFAYLGKYRYSLRFCTDKRAPVFVRDEPVTLVLSQFLRAALEAHVAVIAYCFMPDHVHLLTEGTEERADCRRFIVRGKQYSAFCYARQFGGRLWQRYSFDRVLRGDEATLVVARYILANPVRAGLVGRVEEYPYVGSTVYSLRELLDGVQDIASASG
jgi:putative transposase